MIIAQSLYSDAASQQENRRCGERFLRRRTIQSWLLQRMILLFLFICLILSANTVYADNQDPYPFTSSVEAERFHALTREIRCVVCQNQNIADSNAPLANDLRDKVYQMVLAQQSNNEIKDYLVKRYGEFILLQPRFNKSTIALWLFPFIGIAVIFSILFRFMYRRR